MPSHPATNALGSIAALIGTPTFPIETSLSGRGGGIASGHASLRFAGWQVAMLLPAFEPKNRAPRMNSHPATNALGFIAALLGTSTFPIETSRSGRGGGIRTHGLFVPNEARYQTAPHPDMLGKL